MSSVTTRSIFGSGTFTSASSASSPPVAIALGVAILFIAVGQYGDWDLLRANIPPPTGRSGSAPRRSYTAARGKPSSFFATVSFIAWAMREVDICRKLQMGYHVPAMFSLAISAWVILQIIRPLLMGCWCEGFDLELHRPPDVGLEYRFPVS